MEKVFFAFILVIQSSGFGLAQDLSYFDTRFMHKTNFFVGSVRRDVKESESTQFLDVRFDDRDGNFARCGGFRVQNEKNRFYVATARHCFKYKENEFCEKNFIKVLPLKSAKKQFVGTCNRIVVASEKQDLMIFEINIADVEGNFGDYFASTVKEVFPSFKLAAYLPVQGTPLTIYGFPVDPIRDSKPTVTENCIVLPEEAKDAVYAASMQERRRLIEKYHKSLLAESEYVRDMRKKLEIIQVKHNCSVYVGNSGAPIRIPGTQDVVGLPFDGWLTQFQPVPDYYSRNFESTKKFVDENRQQLKKEGIEISEIAPRVKLKPIPSYFKKLESI